MQQFRPASAIEADRVLAEAFRAGDDAAIRSMVHRFGAPVTSLLTAHDAAGAAVDVFVQAWIESDEFSPGDDFAPWLRSIAVAVVGGRDIDDHDLRRWEISAATASFDTDDHAALRRHHVDGVDLPIGAERHELRLQRRVAHLGEHDEVVESLADPLAWERPADGLADRVVARIAKDSESAVDGTFSPPESRSRLARSVRPALLGLVAAIAVLFVAIIGLSAASGSVDEPVFTVELIPTGLLVDVEAGELTVTATDNGLQLDVDAFTLPRRAGDQFYEAILLLDDGTELSAGSFTEGVGVTLSAGVAIDRVDSLRIVASVFGVDADDNDAVLKADFPQT